ncbi:hypothetical protein HZB00_03550 [Candidatus Woesearchaeota archaeon]|nr:hypothetical protein [Candidatus Woesearchaeota archaeon]
MQKELMTGIVVGILVVTVIFLFGFYAGNVTTGKVIQKKISLQPPVLGSDRCMLVRKNAKDFSQTDLAKIYQNGHTGDLLCSSDYNNCLFTLELTGVTGIQENFNIHACKENLIRYSPSWYIQYNLPDIKALCCQL